MKTTVVLLAALTLRAVFCDDYDEDPPPVTCEARCLRIHERSLDRIGFSKVGADRYIDKPKTEEKTLRDVCWKKYDYFYCMKGCVKTKEHEKYARHVKSRCKQAVEDLEPGLSCLFKYRNFLEIRCSSFLNEAIRLKQADDPELLPDKETCRYLHLNAICLENSVSQFCPQANSFFRRLNLRDYFFNFILPADDELFDDQDLDACQMKDFVKEALEGVKVRKMENDETTTPAFNFTSTTSTYEDDDNPKDDNTKDDKDDDNSEEAWPVTTHPPAIVRTLSPSTRHHSSIQTSTTSNFVYTTPTRKQSSSTLIGTVTTPIHITKEQAMRTTTARGEGGRGERITITTKSQFTTTTARPTTIKPSTTTSRRRLFDSDEDFSQTPPNFLWGSFRGENYKLARNYSESFPPDAEFVTPVTLESSSLFGDEDDSRNDDVDYDRTHVIDIDREPAAIKPITNVDQSSIEPITVTGKPVKLSTIVTLIDEKEKKRMESTTRKNEDYSSQMYEHAVDTQLQPTTHVYRPLPIDSAEATTVVRVMPGSDLTTVARVLPTDWDLTTVAKILPTDSDFDDDVDLDENEIRAQEEMEERNRVPVHPDPRSYEEVTAVEVLSGEIHRKEAENNFDRALGNENEEDDSNEIQKTFAEEKLNLHPAITSTRSPEPFTPLINGGRVAVKSIKQFRAVGEEESAQDWTEDPNIDDAHVDLDDGDDYDKETYVTSEIRPDESPRDEEVRRRINFILAYTSLFFILLLLVVCCILCVIIKNRKNASMDRPYKMGDSI
ncbi:hypothetical protein PRIPAC_85192 [Pristionchus pacificus]|uniref:Uncharacterized protein n=1 Tax=Pristionchus pacificus TaxID=54126 RepID=A0A2A6CE91_PRIPA|nr:hypothetical protein PRIPAC_85192 [Pristionchus pacificus]|eukprot:PDM76514.1 hypothetical protein PRIPAC_42880 [Pristionchus pacificus]